MQALNIEPTKTTPEVKYDETTFKFSISGHSYPENSVEFYQPIIEWIRHWMEEKPSEAKVIFKLEYFNTSSSKSLLDIFDVIEDGHTDGVNIKVEWHYQEEDDDMRDSGEDFAEDLTLPIELVSYE